MPQATKVGNTGCLYEAAVTLDPAISGDIPAHRMHVLNNQASTRSRSTSQVLCQVLSEVAAEAFLTMRHQPALLLRPGHIHPS